MAFNNEDNNGPIRKNLGNTVSFKDKNDNNVPDEVENVGKAVFVGILIWIFGPMILGIFLVILFVGVFLGFYSFNTVILFTKYLIIAISAFLIIKAVLKWKSLSTVKKSSMLAVGIFLLFVISFLNSFLLIKFEDFSKKKTIELKGIKVDTLYKITDFDNALVSVAEENIDKFGTEGDCAVIIFKEDIPNKYLEKYKEQLLEDGYTFFDNRTYDFLLKNNLNNTFTIIAIEDSNINYWVLDGKYEDYIDKILTEK